MKKMIFYVFVSMVICDSAISQNYIHNAGFEDINLPTVPTTDDIENSYDFLEVWCDDSKPDHCLDDDFGTEYTVKLHSPDWFNLNLRPLSEMVNSTPVLISPSDGNSFVGMGSGEIVEQRFFNSSPVEEGHYLLTFYIRLVTSTDLGFGHGAPSDGVELKVFFAKDKIKYELGSCGKWCSSCTCSDNHGDYWVKIDGITQQIEEKGSIPLSTESFPLGSWHKVSMNISIDQDNYDYIGFELNDYYCATYVLIDDFSLVKGCIDDCSGTDGPVTIHASGTHSDEFPFTVFDLKNISEANMKIYPYGGQVPIWEMYFYHPSTRISWTGKSGVNGGEAAAGYYICMLWVNNDCGEYNYQFNFTKINDIIPTTSDWQFFTTYPIYKPPDVCCMSDIYIHDVVMYQDPWLTYPLLIKAINSVTAGPNVIIPAINTDPVIFEAGSIITLLPGFSTESNAEFIAQIVPCNGNKSLECTSLTSLGDENEFQSLRQKEQDEIDHSFKCFPNPASEFTTMVYSVPYNGKTIITLTSTIGYSLEVFNGIVPTGDYQLTLNCHTLSSGVYICNIYSEGYNDQFVLCITR